MEVFRRKILKLPTELQNSFSIGQSENTYVTFLNAMLNTSSKYDTQILNICETVRYIIFYVYITFVSTVNEIFSLLLGIFNC